MWAAVDWHPDASSGDAAVRITPIKGGIPLPVDETIPTSYITSGGGGGGGGGSLCGEGSGEGIALAGTPPRDTALGSTSWPTSTRGPRQTSTPTFASQKGVVYR